MTQDAHPPFAMPPRVAAEVDAPYALPSDAPARYATDGYVRLPGVLSAETLGHVGPAITRRVQELNTLDLPMDQRSTYQKAFLQVMNLWRHDATIARFVLGRRLGRIAAELMGCRGVRLYHDQALYKEAGGGITPWHADQYYWPLASEKAVTAWIPLQATPLEMGPLAFAPGSQRINLGRDLAISDESERRLARSLRSYPVVEEPFALGDVSFHSGWTFHRAGVNTTERARGVLTIIYVDADMRVAPPQNPEQENDRLTWCPGVAVGDVIDSPINPVIYERESAAA